MHDDGKVVMDKVGSFRLKIKFLFVDDFLDSSLHLEETHFIVNSIRLWKC